jgi:chorismate mutase
MAEPKVGADVKAVMDGAHRNIPAEWTESIAGTEEQTTLTALAARRLALGDMVAAAKYGSSIPVNDDAREERLLSEVVARSREIGLDPAVSRRFFRAQIEANKVVQRRLHALWLAHPELRPRHRPDLESEVRPQLDAITKQMLLRLKALESAGDAAERVIGPRSASLDDLHAEALRIALTPINARGGGSGAPESTAETSSVPSRRCA